MAQLYTKVCLYLEANSKSYDDTKILLQDDGSGSYIKDWNIDGLVKPSDSQIASYETAGNTRELNNVVKKTRRKAYGNIGDQLDEIFKDIDAWKNRIQAIKDANPKG
tara:strand:+ start:284 stop:604 length:321 start_codon:yes stop_codon:yes gene_type:complete